MAKINEIKEQQEVVITVGSFANSLQQIAASRMVKLRDQVLASRRFVNEATLILKELQLEKTKATPTSPSPASLPPADIKTAIIVITSNQGLCGSYNFEIFSRLNQIINTHPQADYFVLGLKGQHFLQSLSNKINLRFYPYQVSETITHQELRPLIGIFYYYQHIYLLYSKYINTANREVAFIELVVPQIETIEVAKEKTEGKYIFEPSIDDLLASMNLGIRYALFREQIFDSRLSLYTAQMMAMKTAADNADNLMQELKLEYNKARRKLVDKKILEVQAGRSLWDNHE